MCTFVAFFHTKQNPNDEREQKMQAWDIYLFGTLIDTVFYDKDCDADYVYRSLVYHDGYDLRIKVGKA